MQKMMFNDRFLLTQAVLERRKKQTRRFPSPRLIEQYNSLLEEYELASKNVGVPCSVVSVEDFLLECAPYKVGEVVAVAQSYSSIVDYLQNPKNATCVEHFEKNCLKSTEILYEADGGKHKGFLNKMFVKSELMPHQVKITNVRVQRLQDITDEECFLEGVREVEVSYNWGNSATHTMYSIIYYDHKGLTKELIGRTPKEVYAYLVDKIHGKGTWEKNPYVFTYDFRLVK